MRSRFWVARAWSSTASANSNGTILVSSPKWPGANTPAATLTVVVIADNAESVAH
jgi:hypothetical protein